MGVPEGEEREKGTESVFEEIMLTMRKEMDIQIQEGQMIPNRINLKKPTLRHKQVYLGDIIGSIPDQHNKTNITIKWVTQIFGYSMYIRVMFVLNNIMSKKRNVHT